MKFRDDPHPSGRSVNSHAVSSPMPPLSRRRALQLGAVAGTGLVGVAVAGPAAATPGRPAFHHGVASGDPLPDAVLLWTRVTPRPGATPGSGVGPAVSVTWEVATDPAFAAIVRSGTVRTGPDRDHTVKVDATGLAPATGYWYRFRCQGVLSPVGGKAAMYYLSRSAHGETSSEHVRILPRGCTSQ